MHTPRMVVPGKKKAPAARERTAMDTIAEALPDVFAALACGLALIRPDLPGFDLLRTAGPLFFLELPMAFVGLFGGALRVDAKEMDRRTKLSFVLTPTLVIGLMALLLLGPYGLLGVLWLSGANLYRWLSGAPPSPPVPGFWIRFSTGADGSTSVSTPGVSMSARSAGQRGGRVREWKTLGGYEQFDAVFTSMFWVMTACLVMFLDLPPGGVTAEYAERVRWDDTLLGQLVAPSTALWCGAILFVIRAFMRFERLAPPEPPPSTVEDDAVLREIIEKVEGKPLPRKNPDKKPRRKRPSL